MNIPKKATFISMFQEPISSYLETSIIKRAREKNILQTEICCLLERMNNNHHKIDDGVYSGGPGQLMRVDVLVPIIEEILLKTSVLREQKRVILLDPSGQTFQQGKAFSLTQYQELIFVCGRYEGIDARIHHFVDESISLGDFILSNGDLAAIGVFDAVARLVPGVLGNQDSVQTESFMNCRLEASNYTRPENFRGFKVPQVLTQGDHKKIARHLKKESVIKTLQLRPDLLEREPLSLEEQRFVQEANDNQTYPWQKTHDKS